MRLAGQGRQAGASVLLAVNRVIERRRQRILPARRTLPCIWWRQSKLYQPGPGPRPAARADPGHCLQRWPDLQLLYPRFFYKSINLPRGDAVYALTPPPSRSGMGELHEGSSRGT